MSPIALALDGLLAALLLLALVVGVRLNARLKALRDSHAGFARSVAELDAAALRAEAALAALRQVGEETHDALLARIETARALAGRLEALTNEAAFSETRPAARPSEPPRSPAFAARGSEAARPRLVRRPAPEDDLFEPADSRAEAPARPEPAEVVELIRRALGERR